MKTISHQTFRGKPSKNDSNALWIGPDHEPTRYFDCTFIPDGAAEALKITRGAKIQVFEESTFHGGIEDCVDLLGCSDITFSNCTFHLDGAKQAFTIKGGAKRIRIDHCTFGGHPRRWTFIDLGGHTIYPDSPITEDVTISNCTFERRTLSLARTWYAKKPTIINSDHKCWMNTLSLPSFFWRSWFWVATATA